MMEFPWALFKSGNEIPDFHPPVSLLQNLHCCTKWRKYIGNAEALSVKGAFSEGYTEK